jgi:leucyl aminopeptidase
MDGKIFELMKEGLINFEIKELGKEERKKVDKAKIGVINLTIDKDKDVGETYIINDGNKKELHIYIAKDEKSINYEDVRKASVNAISFSKQTEAFELFLDIDKKIKDKEKREKIKRAFVEALILATFPISFKEEKDEKEKKKIKTLYVDEIDEDLKKTIIVACCHNYARKIINLPPNIATPEYFVEEANNLAKKHGLNLVVWDKKKLEKEGLNLALAVNAGSDKGVFLIHLSYKSKDKKAKTFAIAGKGICFDSGGLGIKPAKSMANMHLDKSGACIGLAIIKACSLLNINANVDVVDVFTENLISGKATKPSSIIKSYSGKTVEIIHTDAEGRLILADAITYILKHVKPDYLIDIATLTGAMSITLGDKAIGLFTNNDELQEALVKAGYETYERVWPMPMFKEYDEMIKSDVADIKNIGSWEGHASSIIGAKFLEAFVENVPWAHLDIASMMEVSWMPYLGKRGTGCGFRVVLKAIDMLSKK